MLIARGRSWQKRLLGLVTKQERITKRISNMCRTIKIPNNDVLEKLEILLGIRLYGDELQIMEDVFQEHAVEITGILVNSHINN
jgi:hypothetical protein